MIKKTVVTTFLLLSSSSFLAYAGNTDSDNWKKLTNESTSLSAQKQYERALELSSQALSVAEKEFAGEPIRTATSLIQLGAIYYSLNQLAQAEGFYARAIKVQAKAIPPDETGVARNLMQLARIYESQDKYADAETILLRSLEILEKVSQKDSSSLIDPLGLLGKSYLMRSQYELAKPVLLRGLAISEKRKVNAGLDLKELLDNLAELYRKTGKEAEALDVEKRAAAVSTIISPTERYSPLLRGGINGGCHPEWPREALRYELQGVVQINVLVDVDGQVLDKKIMKSTGWKILDFPIFNSMSECRFTPAIRDGNPVQVWSTINYSWKLLEPEASAAAPMLIKDSCSPSEKFSIVSTSEPQPVIRLRFLLSPEGKPSEIKIEDGSNDLDVDLAAMSFLASCKYNLIPIKGQSGWRAGNIRLQWKKNASKEGS